MVVRLLGLRPEDKRPTAVAFGTLVAMLVAHSMLETTRDALFLEKLPPEQLPFAYLAIAALALIVSKVNALATARFSRRKLLSLCLLGGGIITAAFYQLLDAPSALTLGALYVWTGTLATVVVVQFWLLLGDVFDVVQAKRVFGIIGAAGLLGATLGSGLAATILVWLGSPRPLVLVSGFFFVCAALVPLGLPRRPQDSEPRRASRPKASHGKSALQLMRNDAYLQRLFVAILIAAVLVTGVDYIFKVQVVAHKASVLAATGEIWDLGSFFAKYYAVVNGISLIVQLFVAPWLMRTVGVNRALLILPGLLLIGSVGFIVALGLVPALLLKGADGAMRHSVHRISSEILFLPLPKHVRERFKGFAAAMGQRGGQALASVIILGAAALHAESKHIAIALVVLSVAWVFSLLGLQPLYLELFRTQLRDGAIDTELDVPDLDLASFEALVSALSSEQDVEVIAALSMFEGYGKTNLVPALILYHPSKEVVLRAFEMFARSERADVRRLTGRLLKHDDPAIRAAALRVVTSMKADGEVLRQAMADEDPGVRCTALAGMVGAGLIDDDEASEELREMMGGSSFTRLELARALRYLPPDRFAWVGVELATTVEPGLGDAVSQSIIKSPHPKYLQTLLGLLTDREARDAARQAFIAIGEPALRFLEEQLADKSLPGVVRRHLPRTISRFAGEDASQVLLAALPRETDERVLFKILRGLGRQRAHNPDGAIDREQLLDVARNTLRRAITALHWRLVIERVCGKPGETLDADEARDARSTAGDLLVSLLRDSEELAVQRLFRLMHIIEPTQEFRIIYDGLRSQDKKTQASSRELVSHVVPPALRDGILAIVDDVSDQARLRAAAEAFHDPEDREHLDRLILLLREDKLDEGGRVELDKAYAKMLQKMLRDPSDALRSIAGYHVAELGWSDLRSEIYRARDETSDVFGDVAESAIDLLDLNPVVSHAG